MELVNGKIVVHKVFGRGAVVCADERYFTVKFEDDSVGEKTFIFPTAFENVLAFEDENLQSGAAQAATQAIQVSADYSKQIQERCRQEAEAQGKVGKTARTRKMPAKKKS